MEPTPKQQPSEKHVFSVAISMSQYHEGVRITATIGHDDGVEHVSAALQWPTLPEINPGGSVSMWMYGALSQLLMIFDDHEVLTSSTEPSMIAKEINRG